MTEIRVGDTVTFETRPKWWVRLAIRLKLVTPPAPRVFVVTSTTASPQNRRLETLMGIAANAPRPDFSQN